MTKGEIGAILKELRLKTGKTQKEIAEQLGRKQQIIGHWETGYSQPDANTLFTLCEIYGTTVDKAFGFKNDTKINRKDIEIINKYNTLDSTRKEVVDILLNTDIGDITVTIGSNKYNFERAKSRLLSYYYKLASAGNGQYIFDSPPEKQIEIPDIPEYRNASYSIGVNGDSMEPEYSDGDILLIEPTEDLNIGEIGIFYLNGNCYVKKLGKKELISLNPDYENIPINETIRSMGRVIGKIDKHE